MAIKVMSGAEAAEKWGRVAASRGSDYEAGVKGAGSDWEAKTKAAMSSFVAGVTNGNIGKMFAGGVQRAGAGKYERKASGVGKDRYSSGVNAAIGDYATGVEPMLQTIASISLPARAPRGSSSNLDRVRVIADALNKKRLALRSAGQ